MGIDATLTVVPRGQVRRKERAADLTQFQLYRDWHELRGALEAMGRPASLALRSNSPGSELDESEVELILVPPALVKKIDAALRTIPVERLLAAIRERRKALGRQLKSGWRLRKYERESKVAAFDTLRVAYARAAKQDAYLEVFIG